MKYITGTVFLDRSILWNSMAFYILYSPLYLATWKFQVGICDFASFSNSLNQTNFGLLSSHLLSFSKLELPVPLAVSAVALVWVFFFCLFF